MPNEMKRMLRCIY